MFISKPTTGVLASLSGFLLQNSMKFHGDLIRVKNNKNYWLDEGESSRIAAGIL